MDGSAGLASMAQREWLRIGLDFDGTLADTVDDAISLR
jgi:hypothetical protein